jgi:HTH-type transcriptional regulator / antitoxin HigA
MSDRSAFERDWRVSPGETVRAIMASRDMLDGDVSAQLDLTLEGFADLICGRIPIDLDLADRLAEVLGPSSRFWLSRETLYRQPPQATPPDGLAGEQSAFIARLPVADMRKLGWIDAYDRASRQNIVLRFFEDDYGDWRRNGRDLLEAVAFRTSPSHPADPAAVAAWLRQGVRQARSLACSDWDPEGLVQALDDFRALTRKKNPSVFFPQLVDLGRRYGVAIVCVRTPVGCRASGATHFAPWGVPIVQLSFRYRSDDHFWFTVFHEIGHLLLHRASPMFVEGTDYTVGEEESEADAFAQETLIRQDFRDELLSLGRDFKRVMRFAKRAGVSPGIVVGQMQKRGLIRYDQLNFLKARYDWSQVAEVSL